MCTKTITGATCACLAIISFNVNAALVSIDWKTSGDNLITRDSVSGLDWLDLTETNNLSYDFVNSQLSTSGQYAGFRYATESEVVTLWANFGIDLNIYTQGLIEGRDPGVSVALGLLGETMNWATSVDEHGVFGYTSKSYPPFMQMRGVLGASSLTVNGVPYTQIWDVQDLFGQNVDKGTIGVGSYLVKTSVIPIPAAIWLFGSGMVCLIGISRRKNKKSRGQTP